MRTTTVHAGATSLALLVVACGGGRTPRDAGLDAVIVLPDGAVERVDTGIAEDASSTELPDAPRPLADGSAPDGGSAHLAFCRRGCATADDCASASVLYDASHFRCEAGLCAWQGCRSSAECASAFGTSAYACRDVLGLSQCVHTCDAPADCASSAAFDADNYACESGACRYLGCNDDDECAATFASAAYVCRAVLPPDLGVPLPTALRNCVHRCGTSSDCASSSAFDADNYRCEGDACVYTGCLEDEECDATFGTSGAYLCR